MKIQELTLYTSKLREQAAFYAEVLELKTLAQSEKSVSFQIGNSTLRFEEKIDATPYHFAINIPANKEHEALTWLKSKLEILKDGEDQIINFTAWNAKAIYFYDKDKNIVELISRRNLNNRTDQNFGPDQFLEISEIGVPTKDVKTVYDSLKQVMGIEIYDGAFGNFCAVGDENGLFICINMDRKDWYPTNDKAYSSDFKLNLLEKGNHFYIEFKNGEIKVIAP
ncbi:VOC family protein [Arenibacter sp. F20364]|uniref:VOC family protein n=1 Tax=Arenibacter sp. F20364 TaxID=2926415 RepID=UPI001FF2D745|nr:VOC family protein [Arenibacter sp. F20364]MCK0190422.1 VOC family protein [Arenibacter sp. F20364]